jgi:hypothetical protein
MWLPRLVCLGFQPLFASIAEENVSAQPCKFLIFILVTRCVAWTGNLKGGRADWLVEKCTVCYCWIVHILLRVQVATFLSMLEISVFS